MVAADDAGRSSDIAGKLGVEPGMIVQELGWDNDVDETVRDAVEERAGDELLDEDAVDVIERSTLCRADIIQNRTRGRGCCGSPKEAEAF